MIRLLLIISLLLVGCGTKNNNVTYGDSYYDESATTYYDASTVLMDICTELSEGEVVRLDDIDVSVQLNDRGRCTVTLQELGDGGWN